MKKYDTYKDSGIEWIGEIPEGWNCKRFKYCFDLISEKTKTALPKIGLENIDSWTGKYLKTSTEFEGDGEVFEVDDILYGKLRPYLAKVLLANFSGKAVGDIFVFRSKDEIIPGYGHRLILSKPFIEITNSSTFGSKMPRVSWEFISDLEIPIPTKPEQTQIANYLDRKTTEIDQLITDKKALVELYKEEKTAIINQAVTKGINPDAKMKDSGIEWLGEIPEHWEVIRGKYLYEILSGFAPSNFELNKRTIEYYKVDDLNYLNGEFILQGLGNQVEELENINPYPKGTILFPKRGAAINLNKIAITQNLCYFDTNLMGLKIISSRILKMFLCHFISNRGLIDIADTSTIPQINNKHISPMEVILPPFEEQTQIVQQIEAETQRIENKIIVAEMYITLLTEYRTALISEVVTGKIKVAEA